MPATLPDGLKAALDAPTFVHLTTLDPDGSPQASAMWVQRYGERIVCEPSRFLEELPADQLEWIGGSKGSQQKSSPEKGRSHLESLKQLLG